MKLNFLSKVKVSSIVPRNILSKEGDFTLLGLMIYHDGRGRVVIKGIDGKLISDSHYYSPDDVVGVINTIIETKGWH